MKLKIVLLFLLLSIPMVSFAGLAKNVITEEHMYDVASIPWHGHRVYSVVFNRIDPETGFAARKTFPPFCKRSSNIVTIADLEQGAKPYLYSRISTLKNRRKFSKRNPLRRRVLVCLEALEVHSPKHHH